MSWFGGSLQRALALHVEVIARGIGDMGIDNKSRPGVVSLGVNVRIFAHANLQILDGKEPSMHALDDANKKELGAGKLAVAVGLLERALDERKFFVNDRLVLVLGDTIAEEEDLVGQFASAWFCASRAVEL